MPKIAITVLFGRQKVQIEAEETGTFGDLRAAVEQEAGVVSHGIRLMHKGKTMTDANLLQAAGVKTGTKLMAMRTQRQHDAERQQEKLHKFQTAEKDLSKSAEKPDEQTHEHVSTSRVICGDEEIDGQCYIIVSKGRTRYRINIELTALGKEVKERLCKMEGIDGVASNMRLLSSGKFLTDANTLLEQGVRPGGTMIALFNSRHHDLQEARTDVERMAEEIGHMETNVKSWLKKTEKRLVSTEESSVQRSTLTQGVRRVRANLQTVRTNDERIDGLNKRLDELGKMLEDE